MGAVKRTDLRESFITVDQRGHRRTVNVFVPVIDISDLENPTAETHGRPILKTGEGQTVKTLSDGRYQVIQTGEILTKKA